MKIKLISDLYLIFSYEWARGEHNFLCPTLYIFLILCPNSFFIKSYPVDNSDNLMGVDIFEQYGIILT